MKNGKQGNHKPHDILERSFQFAVRIVRLCAWLDGQRGVSRVLMPQILRAGTSVVSNVEEAQAAQSRADFVSGIAIALKEARETHIRLRVLSAADVLPSNRIQALTMGAEGLKRILGAIVVSTRTRGVSAAR
jgi:four helix bundle protein